MRCRGFGIGFGVIGTVGDLFMGPVGEMKIWVYSVIVRSWSITAIDCMREFKFNDEDVISFVAFDLEVLATLSNPA